MLAISTLSRKEEEKPSPKSFFKNATELKTFKDGNKAANEDDEAPDIVNEGGTEDENG